MQTSTFVIIRDDEGIVRVTAYDRVDTDVFFHTISKHYAFADCSGDDIIAIYWRGKEVCYVGWQPNMRFEYKDLNGKTVWVGDFPNWNH